MEKKEEATRKVDRRTVVKGAAGVAAAGAVVGVGTRLAGNQGAQANALLQGADEIASARELTPEDVTAALKTYMPSGRHDEYLIFASGGHSGQILVIGVPSMRLLKVIGVFTPEPWQGYGFTDDHKEMMLGAGVDGKMVTWGDTHHPSLSETEGEYDGQFLFINDKAHARLAVIDLRDFETKQMIKNPHVISNHGGAFVTPNTEYIIDGSQYATPFGWEYAPLDEYKDKYRGGMTLWKFDRDAGRVNKDESFTIELPPYWNDLADAGKGDSFGWLFSNTFNVEMATGATFNDGPPTEAGASQRDMDYLDIIHWEKAAEVFAAGNTEDVNGMQVIRMPVAIEEGIVYQVPVPKSPHGADVTPDGKFIVTCGKLDPHVTIYSFAKIQETIAAGNFETDEFGVPVLDFESCVEAQLEVGLGPLHTQFDNEGHAYTSLFLDSAIARWKLGGEGIDDGWTVVDKISVNYNVGHLTCPEGDTVTPQGNYVIALNKWAIDRFSPVGPLLPQNFQLIDTTGEQMQLLYDCPIGIGEPHYAQTIRADRLEGIVWSTYPEVGWDPGTMAPSEFGTDIGEESVEVDGTNVTVNMSSIRSHLTPDFVEVNVGDAVTWHVTNVELALDATHGFTLPGQNVNVSIEPGETATFSFVADTPGTYPFYCTEFCSALHLEMMGYFLVKP